MADICIDYTTKITISRSESDAKFIKLDDTDYYSTLRTKMGWSGNVR